MLSQKLWCAYGFLSLLPTLLVVHQAPGDQRLHPVDEALTQPALVVVRDRAKAAAVARRTGLLTAMIAEDEALRHSVRTVLPGDDAFWLPTIKALTHGGRFRAGPSGERRFCAPWAEHALLEDVPQHLVGPEALEPAVVLEPIDVNSSPNLNGDVVRRIPNGYLRMLEQPQRDATAMRVGLAGSWSGWVPTRSVWTVFDSPVCFALRDGDWRIVEIGGRW